MRLFLTVSVENTHNTHMKLTLDFYSEIYMWIKCTLHQVLRLPNYLLSQDYFIFTIIVILLS